ncbi:MAG: AI-2E family transporter [Steroidobacteraceae bacterium]
MAQRPQSALSTNRFYARVFALSTALLIGLACYRIVTPFLGPLLWAIFFAFLLGPTHVRLTRKLRNRGDHSALLLTGLALVALLGPLAAFGGAFVHQASNLLQYLQGLIGSEARNDLQQLSQHPLLQNLLQWLNQNLGISAVQMRGWLGEATGALLQLLANLSGQLFLGALGTAAGLFLTLFFMFFFIRDGGQMLRITRELIPMPAAKRQALYEHLAAVTRAVMIGTGLTALIQGTLVGLAFLIVQLPSPLVFGVLAALLALLPFGGTAIVWLPAAVILAAQDRWVAATFMLVWGALLVSMIDNFLKPLLISGRAEVATLTIFIGVLGGVTAFGAIGLFLGPVVLALAIALIQFALETKREAEQLHSTSPDP